MFFIFFIEYYTLADMNFFIIYCHSPGGNTAVALSDMAFHMTYIQSPHGDNATALAEFAVSECSCITVVLFPCH